MTHPPPPADRPSPGLALLGPPGVIYRSGSIHEIRGARPAALLAVLAANRGERLSAGAVHEQVWGDVERTDSLLRVTLNRLRAQLAVAGIDQAITHDRLGLHLDVAGITLDTNTVEHAVRRASELRRGGKWKHIVDVVDATEELWRGRPYEGIEEASSVTLDAARLTRLRFELRRARSVALIRLREFDAASTELLALVDHDPHREDTAVLLAAVRYVAGHPRDAHRVLAALHRDLSSVGLVLGPGGRRIEQLIVDGAAMAGVLAAALGNDAPDLVVGRRRLARWKFIGRDALVEEIVLDLTERRAVRIIEGEAGAGKTRVGWEIADRLAAVGGVVLWSGCERHDAPLSPIPDLLRAAEALSVAAHADGGHEGAVFDEALAASPEVPQDVQRDVDRVQPRLDDRLERVLRDRVENVTIVVDDLHWIGPDGAAMLRRLIDRQPTLSWALLCRTADRTAASRELVADLARQGHEVTRLQPLGHDELRQLSTAVDPKIGSDLIGAIVERADGNPFLAIELTRHVQRGGDPAATPATVHAALDLTLRHVGPAARRLAEFLAIESGLGTTALATLVGTGGADRLFDQAVDALVEAGVVRVGADRRPVLAHDLWADVILASLDDARLSALHRDVGAAVLVDHGRPEIVLRHVLAAGALAAPTDIDRAAADGIAALVGRGAMAEAAEFARSYIDRRGVHCVERDHAAGLIQAAGALLAGSEFDDGLAVLDAIKPALERIDDPQLSADAILARGAVDVGNRGDEAERERITGLADRLGGDVHRAVQLHCWVAHSALNSSDPQSAAAALDRAGDALATATNADPFLRGLVLGVHHQSTLHVGACPADASASYSRLERYASLTGDLPSRAIVAMFGIERALRHDGAAAARRRVDQLAALAEELPRPDMMWWALAGRVAVDLAAGDIDSAERDLEAVATQGAAAQLPFAAHVALTQQMVVALERGALIDKLPGRTPGEADTMPPVLAALSGVLAALDGDRATSRAIADRLAARRRLLEAEGLGWPVLAFATGELVAASGSTDLAIVVSTALTPYRGIGLSLAGLAYLGVADRILATCAFVLGDHETAAMLARAAGQLESTRGFPTWGVRATTAVR